MDRRHCIQLVSGTCGRPNALRAMIESARAACDIPGLLSFIIVDCGGDAETQHYCQSQPDIMYINQGGRFGAISAFNAGCARASAEYVLLANDDVLFFPHSITRAWRYLEDDAGAAAVAFMDNRPVLYKQRLEGNFGVELFRASGGTKLVYAQVGLFRRWLGDLAGWWGRDDPIFGQHAHTYGGDNYLSARLYELGYRIEIVQGVRVTDLVLPDLLRHENHAHMIKLPSAYYKRYPSGFQRASAPRVYPSRAHRPTIRILYLPIYEPGFFYGIQKANKRGLREAFADVGACIELDYINTPVDLIEIGRAFRPNLLFIQMHSADQITSTILERFRSVSPETFIVTWNGDVYPQGYTSPDMLNALREVDLALGVNADALEIVQQKTGTPARYWQVGFEPAVDNELTEQHEIVFLGNRYQGRDDLDAFLKHRNVTVVGSGWSFPAQPNCTYDFQAGRNWYRSAKTAIGDNVHGARGFVSNRMFEALAAGGALYFQQTIPDLEHLTGLKDGVHYIAWSDFDDLSKKLDHWLDPARDVERRQIARRAMEYVRQHHSFAARVKQLWKLIEGLNRNDD